MPVSCDCRVCSGPFSHAGNLIPSCALNFPSYVYVHIIMILCYALLFYVQFHSDTQQQYTASAHSSKGHILHGSLALTRQQMLCFLPGDRKDQ